MVDITSDGCYWSYGVIDDTTKPGDVVKTPDKPKTLEEIERRIKEELENREKLHKKIYMIRDYTFLVYLDKKKKITSKEHKLLRNVQKYNIYRAWKTYNLNVKDIDAKKWKIIKDIYDKYIILYDQLFEEYKIMDKKKELCRLTECYKDKKKTKPTKVLLQTCEYCGVDTRIDGSYCSNCGKPVKF